MKFRCVCGFIYDGSIHNEADDYVCPICTTSKRSFKKLQGTRNVDRQSSNEQAFTETMIPETNLEESGIVDVDGANDFFPGITQRVVVNFRIKESSNFITEYRESKTNRLGFTNGFYAPDGAYLEHSFDETLVKFMQAGVVGWVLADEVQVVNFRNKNILSLSHYIISNDTILHVITTNLTSPYYANRINVGPASAAPYLQPNRRYFSYDGHYFYDEAHNDGDGYLTMITDYRNNTRKNAVNAQKPYYNYFQYLSHRSISTYSAEVFDTFLATNTEPSSKMRDTGNDFVNNQNTFGVNALLMMGVAANESNWGMSVIAQTLNNLFGHGAYDIDAEGNAIPYPSIRVSILQHAYVFLSSKYLNPVSDFRYYGAHLGDKASGINVRYAADAYWGEKSASMAWEIDQASGGNDRFRYTIGIKDPIATQHTYVIVRRESSLSSIPLYATSPSTEEGVSLGFAPSNYPYIIVGRSIPHNGFYRIQSDGVLVNNRTQVNPMGKYNFRRDYAFIPSINSIITNVGTSGMHQISISYATYVENLGWLPYVQSNEMSRMIEPSRLIEAIKIKICDSEYSGGVRYQIYSNTMGWQGWVSDNETSGNMGQASSLEAIRIELIGEIANHYDVYYRIFVQNLGWLDWVRNGEVAGNIGFGIASVEITLRFD